jgi:hypothetical protein
VSLLGIPVALCCFLLRPTIAHSLNDFAFSLGAALSAFAVVTGRFAATAFARLACHRVQRHDVGSDIR